MTSLLRTLVRSPLFIPWIRLCPVATTENRLLGTSQTRCLATSQFRCLATSEMSPEAREAASLKKQKKKYYYYRNKNKPKMSEEERLELARDEAEMEASTLALTRDPAALEEFMETGMPEEYDIIYQDPRSKIQAKRDMEKAREITKRRILERKYYRQPPELNLLTWAAKEQIKHLNNEYPDEWTPAQISKSFPISPEGVVKLLKSNYVPRTAENVFYHDKKVVENWKMLSEGNGGVQVERKLDMLKEGGIDTLHNFGGVLSLPKPAVIDDPKTSKRTKPGFFESMVLDSTPPKLEDKKRPKLLPDNSENLKEISKIVRQFERKPNHADQVRTVDYLETSEREYSESGSSSKEKTKNYPIPKPNFAEKSKGRISIKRRSGSDNRTLFQVHMDRDHD